MIITTVLILAFYFGVMLFINTQGEKIRKQRAIDQEEREANEIIRRLKGINRTRSDWPGPS